MTSQHQSELATRIAYNKLDRDYICYATIDGVEQVIGVGETSPEAEQICREYRFNHYSDNSTPEKAAQVAMEVEPQTSTSQTIAKPMLTPRAHVTVADMYAWMYHGGKGYFSKYGSEIVDCSKNDDGTYLIYIRHDPFDKANKHLTTEIIYYPDVMFWCGSLIEPPAPPDTRHPTPDTRHPTPEPPTALPNPGLHLTCYSLILSEPDEPFTSMPVTLCDSCAAGRRNLSKRGEVVNGYCDGCGAGPSIGHFRLAEPADDLVLVAWASRLFDVSEPAMEANIGRRVRFHTPKCDAEREEWEIWFVQRTYDGRLVYRLRQDASDTFGRIGRPDDLIFVDDGASPEAPPPEPPVDDGPRDNWGGFYCPRRYVNHNDFEAQREQEFYEDTHAYIEERLAATNPPVPTPALSLPPIAVLAQVAAELATVAQEAGDTANMHALNKAMMQLHAGTVPVPTTGGFLIESRTRGGTVHRFSTAHGCSCEAGGKGKPCWHASLLEIIEAAQQRAVTAVPVAPVARVNWSEGPSYSVCN